MNRGIVMEIKGRHAMVFHKECGLVRMKAKPDMFVGQAVLIDSAVKAKVAAAPARPVYRRRMLAGFAAAVACLVFLGAGGFLLNGVVSARSVAVVLSVDVNPSIDLMLNRSHEVIKVQARNEEAERLLEGVALEGLGYREAVERWILTIRERWEGKPSQILVSAAFQRPDEAFAATLLELETIPVAGPLAGLEMWVIYSNDRGVAEEAESNGLSVGRQLLLNLGAEDRPGLDPETVEKAQLGDLIQTMLKRGSPDLSSNPGEYGATIRSASDPSGSSGSTGSTIRQTERVTIHTGQGSTETRRETQGSSSPATVQSTARNTENQGTGTGASTYGGTPSTAMQTQQQTQQSTVQKTDPAPAPSTVHSGTGTGSPSGPSPSKP